MSLLIENLSIRLGEAAPLFDPIIIKVDKGEIATIKGRSGIGKSTLLDAIGGHLAPEFTMKGVVKLNGVEITGQSPEARRIGVLFQDALLFPHMSVGDNLAFGLVAHVRGPQRRERIEAALADAGLTGFYDRDPATLSGGQAARAALMRTLLAEPLALLLDEPFSTLDSELRSDIRGFVFDHIRAQNIPALMVTHDAEDAEQAAGQIVTL